MTDKKISELTSITGANVSDANDVLPIVDTSAATTKKITRAELFKSVSSVDINGGTIDGTVIGGASAATATFTSVTANGTINFTGATVSNGGSVTTIDINGGTIDGAVIGGSTPAAISGTDITLSGGVYLGGPGAANYLDDYEEGTWVPVYTGSSGNPTVTYTSQTGRYVKVGNIVHCFGFIEHSSVSGGSGFVFVSGLPFTSSSAGEQAFGQIGFTTAFSAGKTPYAIHSSNNNTYCWLYYRTSVGGSINSAPKITDLVNSGFFYFSVHYTVA